MTIYFYRLRHSWYDDGDEKVFWSETLYSQEEFDDIIARLSTRALEDILSDDNPDIYRRDWAGARSIYDRVLAFLLEEGFHYLEYDADHAISGRGIFDGEGWGEDWLNRMIDPDLIKRAVDYNNDRRDEM